MATEPARRQPIRLSFWMTVCALPALMVLIGLGTWQLQRLEWKEALIAERAARLARPPVAVADIPADDWISHDLRRVHAEGRFLHDRALEIVSRTLRGRAGVHVVTPLVLADGSGTVLVNRGWAPPASERHAGEFRRPRGPVRVAGILRSAVRPGPWVPDNEPARGIWFYADVPAMAAAAGLPEVRPFLIEAAADGTARGYPVGGQTVTAVRNDHLQYALTWYGLAVTLVVIYVLYHLRRRPPPPGRSDREAGTPGRS